MKYKITIQGMHCGSCAGNIEKALKKISGVKNITVSALSKKAFADVDDPAKEEEIKQAVAKAGYKVVAIEK